MGIILQNSKKKEDAFSSEDELLVLTAQAVKPRYGHVVPGDFFLTFNVLVLANSLEGEFPHRAEYWWTLLPGTLDQACTCLSMAMSIFETACTCTLEVEKAFCPEE